MRRDHLWYAAALLFVTSPAVAQEASVAQFSVSSSSTELMSKFGGWPSPSSTAVLDASFGKSVFPLPSASRAFATPSAFAAFLQQSLNAIPIYDGAGNVIGASGRLLQVGRTYYLDANNVVQQVTDPVGAFIGGLGGKFAVGGVTYTTGLQGTSPSDPPASVWHCNSAMECLGGHSWNSHWIFNLRDSVGTEVTQESGGYQENVHFCWKYGFIPWICTSTSGTNQLTLLGTLFYDSYDLYGYGPSYPVPAETANLTRSNTTRLAFESWSYFFGGGGDGLSYASQLIGACGRDGSATVDSIGATAAGSWRADACYGGGVTCLSADDTLCQADLGSLFPALSVCTSLSTDVKHCGRCFNACASGWSCQGGLCIAPPPPPPPPPSPTCRSGYKNCGDSRCIPSTYQCP